MDDTKSQDALRYFPMHGTYVVRPVQMMLLVNMEFSILHTDTGGAANCEQRLLVLHEYKKIYPLTRETIFCVL